MSERRDMVNAAIAAAARITTAAEALNREIEAGETKIDKFKEVFWSFLQAITQSHHWIGELPTPERVNRFREIEYSSCTLVLMRKASTLGATLVLRDVKNIWVTDGRLTVLFTAYPSGLPTGCLWNPKGAPLKISVPADIFYDAVCFDAYMDENLQRIEREDRSVAARIKAEISAEFDGESDQDLSILRELMARYPEQAQKMLESKNTPTPTGDHDP